MAKRILTLEEIIGSGIPLKDSPRYGLICRVAGYSFDECIALANKYYERGMTHYKVLKQPEAVSNYSGKLEGPWVVEFYKRFKQRGKH